MGKKIEELKDKVYQKAYKNEAEYGGCAQSVLGAIKHLFPEKISDNAFKAATGLAGGVGNSGNNCGALTGGVMALGLFRGREYDNFADPDGIQWETYSMAYDLVKKFEMEYGKVNCCGIQRKVIGRSFDFWRKEDLKDFMKVGGHEDKCPSVCGNSARWVIEILDKYSLLDKE